MNLLLVDQKTLVKPDIALIEGRQLQHLRDVLKVDGGSTIQIGQINGLLGTGEVLEINNQQAKIRCVFTEKPPSPLPVTLILAMPRPKMMRRVLQTIATMGVKEIYIINAYKVDKSYWSTPWLKEDALLENCLLGLEQAKDTQLPTIHLRKRFKPFIEDELPSISHNTKNFIAHPGSLSPCPTDLIEPTTLVVGPEGGFTEYEVNKVIDLGFEAIHMGRRIFRVETAIPALLSKLFPFST